MDFTNRWAWLLCISVSTGSVIGCGSHTPTDRTTLRDSSAAGESAAPGQVEIAPSVQTIVAERQPLIVRIEQPGTIEASESAALFSRVSGYVRAVHTDIGDHVSAGQILLETDVPELAQDLAFKKALVAEANAAEAQAKAGVTAAKGTLEAHAAQLALAQAELKKAESDCEFRRREYTRYSDLASKNASTAQLLDERQLVLHTAESACASAEAKLKAVRNERLVLEAKVAAAEADVRKAAAHVAVAEADRDKTSTIIDYAMLKAPFDGVITMRTVDIGEYVASPGSDRAAPLFTLERIDPVTVVVKIPEKEVATVHLGNQIKFQFDGLKDQELMAKVTRLSHSLDGKSRTMRVEIDMANPDGALYPGMYGAASLMLADVSDAVTVPAAALFSHGGELFVFQVRDEKVVRTRVRTGFDDGRIVQVLDGLKGGERVIVSSKGELSDGDRVREYSSIPQNGSKAMNTAKSKPELPEDAG